MTYIHVRFLIDGKRFLIDGSWFLIDGDGFLIDGLSTGWALRTGSHRLLGTVATESADLVRDLSPRHRLLGTGAVLLDW